MRAINSTRNSNPFDVELKHFDVYMERLIHFCNVFNIKVKKCAFVEDSYVPSRRMIKIDTSGSSSAQVAAFLHECGHLVDDVFTDVFDSPQLEEAYYETYNGKPTKKQKSLVIRCEQDAWKLGRRIAKQLKIPLGKWYDTAEKHALKSYRSN